MGARTKLIVRGIVQGVGFRPFVYSLARKQGLHGRVLNNETGVVIDIEGAPESIERFVGELSENPPALSSVASLAREDTVVDGSFNDFRILSSRSNGRKQLSVSSDVATCEDCLNEMRAPADRRYRYPFINCTNCGPRFTILEDLPYDRERTTMRAFPMCETCRAEYEDPLNRRFHAEATCCPACGPRLSLSIDDARELLADGKILAIKGLGGYHLACDARNVDAVTRLRAQKHREDKPFALMAATLDVIKRYCQVSSAEAALIASRERPIVLLDRRPDADLPLSIAPDLGTLGFMLPYTPLHYLLTEGLETPLVMTSGNVSSEPICFDDAEARSRLASIADDFLTHDRRIHIRTDDSIACLRHDGEPMLLRRSRGFAPKPITTKLRFEKSILACGAELKNTFCLAHGSSAYISHHIGDLENLESYRAFVEGIEHYKRLFDIEPEVMAHDLHPEYLSTKFAEKSDLACIGVQHHHAHIASCLVDNDVEGEVIGVAMDGLGFGTDGRMWGGEFFVADFAEFERVAHLEYIPMPGGEKAIREPWRMAAVYLERAFGSRFTDLDIPFVQVLDHKRWTAIASMVEKGTNCPETSSVGRLFDAISALLCLKQTINYEGQAAIALQHIADKSVGNGYAFAFGSDGIVSARRVIEQAVADVVNGVPTSEISARFHLAVADLISDVATNIRDRRGLTRVALSGGVFQNLFLLRVTGEKLSSRGFEVLTHSRVPTNDGGISLGQVAIANAQIRAGRI